MIEKVFEKAYDPTTSRGAAALKRVAKRLEKEYAEVDRSAVGNLPDEVKTIIEQIKNAEETKNYEYDFSYENSSHEGVYDTVKYTREYHIHAFWDCDEYGDSVYCVTWYLFFSERYTKRIGDRKLQGSSYMGILRKVITAKGRYRYFCAHRPPSWSVLPEGFVSYDVYPTGAEYCGEVTYNTAPSPDDIRRFGLVFDNEWEQIRAGYMEVGDEDDD